MQKLPSKKDVQYKSTFNIKKHTKQNKTNMQTNKQEVKYQRLIPSKNKIKLIKINVNK